MRLLRLLPCGYWDTGCFSGRACLMMIAGKGGLADRGRLSDRRSKDPELVSTDLRHRSAGFCPQPATQFLALKATNGSNSA